MKPSQAELSVYIRTYCHLCEDMLAQLEHHRQRLGFQLTIIDIEDDDTLERLYGEKIPVLKAGEYELCHYFLDESALYGYFEGRKKPI